MGATLTGSNLRDYPCDNIRQRVAVHVVCVLASALEDWWWCCQDDRDAYSLELLHDLRKIVRKCRFDKGKVSLSIVGAKHDHKDINSTSGQILKPATL
jgi:hypothetical protein